MLVVIHSNYLYNLLTCVEKMAPVPITIEPNPVKRYSIPNIIVTTAINVMPRGLFSLFVIIVKY